MQKRCLSMKYFKTSSYSVKDTNMMNEFDLDPLIFPQKNLLNIHKNMSGPAPYPIPPPPSQFLLFSPLHSHSLLWNKERDIKCFIFHYITKFKRRKGNNEEQKIHFFAFR